MFIPPIIVRQDVGENIRLCLSYLYHKWPQQRLSILSQYPELAEAAALSEELSRPKIADFVRGYFETRKEEVDRIIANIDLKLQTNGPRALETLATIMEYRWPETHAGFTFVPSLLPFSPWNRDKNMVYLSLLPYLRGDAGRVENNRTANLNELQLLAHEVSHLIFWDIVEKLGTAVSHANNETVSHLAQEILAPVVMNRPEFSMLDLNGYWGNPYLKPIILHTDTVDVNIVDYFSRLYAEMHAEGKTFKEYLKRVFEVLGNIQVQLEERMEMWKKNGNRIYRDKTLLAEYCKPIEIKRSRSTLMSHVL